MVLSSTKHLDPRWSARLMAFLAIQSRAAVLGSLVRSASARGSSWFALLGQFLVTALSAELAFYVIHRLLRGEQAPVEPASKMHHSAEALTF